MGLNPSLSEFNRSLMTQISDKKSNKRENNLDLLKGSENRSFDAEGRRLKGGKSEKYGKSGKDSKYGKSDKDSKDSKGDKASKGSKGSKGGYYDGYYEEDYEGYYD